MVDNSVTSREIAKASGNTVKDGTGDEWRLVVDANGYLQVKHVSTTANPTYIRLMDGDSTTLADVLADQADGLANTLNSLVTSSFLYGFDTATASWDRLTTQAQNFQGLARNVLFNMTGGWAVSAGIWQFLQMQMVLADGETLDRALHVASANYRFSQLDTNWERIKTAEASIHATMENIVASQDFILIDLSDTTNWPHAGSGSIRMCTLLVDLDPDGTFAGDIEIGYLENVDGTNGDFIPIKSWHMDRKALPTEEQFNYNNTPIACVSGALAHLSSDPQVNDVAFQTDVALWSTFDPTAAYSTFSGDGDLVVRLTVTAGAIDMDFQILYYVQ